MTKTLTPKQFSHNILTWFEKFGRKDLPWQGQDAYRIWLSEIMLQQTQVKTVIPYYHRFTTQFPTIIDLAHAELDDVLSLWAGLGYYARARNAHRCAQIIAEHYSGEFPNDLQRLIELPGIGRSTAGAILAQAFHQQASILDGNVKRVLCRYAGITEFPGATKIQNQLWDLAETLTPAKNIANYTQAMMDLGAMICTRSKPQCTQCPLQFYCIAYQTQQTEKIPAKKPRKILPQQQKQFLILKDFKDRILLFKRPPQGIWGGLWSFPEFDMNENITLQCIRNWGLSIQIETTLPQIQHTFSHFQLHIFPIIAKIKKIPTCFMENDDIFWYNNEHTSTIGVAKPVKDILGELICQE